MHAAFVKPLDWFAIQLARLSVHRGIGTVNQAAQIEALLRGEDFLADFVVAPDDLVFSRPGEFQFSSPVVTRWERNNTVRGRLYTCGPDWREKPAVVLLHGWNAERGYRMLFPRLARGLVRRGVNAAMIELPYHSQRKPQGRHDIRNFISGDLLHVVQAAHQSLADARALIGWLQAQGCGPLGVWGVSLGGWLAGLLACADPRLDFAVLFTPVARMDRVIAELDFCAPIRRSLRGAPVQLDVLNLGSHRPKLPPENMLLVASEHDLFAPVETLEELWRVWGQPEFWRPRHGHISVLMSRPVLERALTWAGHAASTVESNTARTARQRASES